MVKPRCWRSLDRHEVRKHDDRHMSADTRGNSRVTVNAKAEQKQQTHETILASAEELLRTRGISGARVADVMKGAGLTVGGFYAHFPSKEALIDETLRRTTEAIRTKLFADLDKVPSEDRPLRVLKRYLSGAHRDSTTL